MRHEKKRIFAKILRITLEMKSGLINFDEIHEIVLIIFN